MINYTVHATLTVTLPDDKRRMELYGKTDPRECIEIDLGNDAPAFFLDQVQDFAITSVEETR